MKFQGNSSSRSRADASETLTDKEIDMTQVASTSYDKANGPEKWNVIMAEDTVNNGKLQTRIKLINSPHVEEPTRLITIFTTARHLPLFWVTVTQSTPSHPISLILILILSSHIRFGLSIAHFPASFPPPLPLHATRQSPSHPQLTARISCYFLHLALKYLPQRPLLELPQAGSFP